MLEKKRGEVRSPMMKMYDDVEDDTVAAKTIPRQPQFREKKKKNEYK